MYRLSTVNKPKQSKTDFDVRGQQQMDFSTGGSVIKDCGLILW